jgi:tetratricopeptide (TPR) repeat protein
MSVQSVVFEPEKQAVHVSVGEHPTGRGPYREVKWDWDVPVGHQTIEDNDLPPRRPGPGTDNDRAAFEHWKRACHDDSFHHDPAQTLEMIEQAVSLAPSDPTYRFMAGVLQLRQGEWDVALEHLSTASQQTNPAFRQVQTLLWGARAADAAGKPELAKQWRHEGLQLHDQHTDPIHRLIQKDLAKGCSTRKLKKLIYSIDIPDAAV